MNATNIRKGQVLRHEGDLCVVHDFQKVKPGKGGAFIQTTLRNLTTGNINKVRFRSSDDVEQVTLDTRRVQYLYKDDANFYFMDMREYNTIEVSAEMVGERKNFLKEEMTLNIDFCEGNPVELQLPTTVNLKVTYTEPGVKGDTVSNNFKPATVETGMVVQVPLFIEQGELIQVDTRSGEYIGRAN